VRRLVILSITGTVALVAAGCGNDSAAPTTPTPPPVQQTPPRLTAPAVDSPSTNQQLDTLRPTLTVRNGTSDQAGTHTYEFQISDNADFAAAGLAARGYKVVVSKVGIAEASSGTTSLTVDEDLQPTTRLHWRARMVQGTTVGRSGTESASIAGATYRNIWLGTQPRPASLGSALLER